MDPSLHRTPFAGPGYRMNGGHTLGTLDCRISCDCPEPTKKDLQKYALITMVVGIILGIIATIVSIACPIAAIGVVFSILAGLAATTSTSLFIASKFKTDN